MEPSRFERNLVRPLAEPFFVPTRTMLGLLGAAAIVFSAAAYSLGSVGARAIDQADQRHVTCLARPSARGLMKLPRFGGHRTICVRGVHDGQDKRSLPA